MAVVITGISVIPGAATQPDALARLREALGGEAALGAVRSIRARSTIQRARHKDHVEIKVELPDRFLRTLRYVTVPELPGGNALHYGSYDDNMRLTGPVVPGLGDGEPGVVMSGFNGQTVIPSQNRFELARRPEFAAQVLTGTHARFAEFILPLLGNMSPLYSVSATSEGHTIVFRASGGRWWQLDLDPVTNLPHRMSWTTPIPPHARAGTMPSYWQVVFGDFKPVAGLRWPHHLIKSRNGAVDEDSTVERYELNARLNFPK